MLLKLAARDLLIAALIVCAWTVERRLTTHGALFWTLSVAGGIGYGLIGFLLHEWGHLAGSRLTGSVVHVAPRLRSPLLFHFDTSANDRRQFLWMSAGGYALSTSWTAFVLAHGDPSRWSDRIGMIVVLIGIVGTFTAELPMTIRVWRGAPLPTGAAFSNQW